MIMNLSEEFRRFSKNKLFRDRCFKNSVLGVQVFMRSVLRCPHSCYDSVMRLRHGFLGVFQPKHQLTQQEQYKLDLKRQMEEKQNEKDLARKKQAEEDEKEEARIREQMSQIQAEYEKEQEKIRMKAEEVNILCCVIAINHSFLILASSYIFNA